MTSKLVFSAADAAIERRRGCLSSDDVYRKRKQMQWMYTCTNNILACGRGGGLLRGGAFGVACDAALLGNGNLSRAYSFC